MNAAISRLNAALEGRYRIERELGAGGMATVYLAQDLKHDRRVAIKVLKPELAAVLGADRFLAEIRTTANLQHPHILPLFDSGEADRFLYYVMPYVEGETLRERLERERQLGIEEAVRIAREIADALDYAHRHDVIHRDIKPENILLHDGRPVVADFGVALAVSAAAGGRMTETGTSVGTPHYMSPEQATADRTITGRSDIYSLGSVLYEMLAGEPPHTASSAQQVIMKIIADAPRPVESLRRSVPHNVAAAVGKALEKLPADRFESARAFADALADPHFTTGVPAAGGAALQTAGRAALVAGFALALFGVLAAAWAWQRPGPQPTGPRVALTLDVDVPDYHGQSYDISPAGDAFVFSTASGIAVRLPGQRSFRVLPGTQGGVHPVFSPRGDTILFALAGRLRRIAVAGGAPLAVLSMDTVNAAFPQWGEDGTIAFQSVDGIRLIPRGATESRLIPDTRRASPVSVLPDGSVLYTEVTANIRLLLFDIAADSSVVLLEDAGAAEYVPTGHIIVGRQGRGLFAMPFDAKKKVVTGPPVAVLPDAVADATSKYFAISASGTIVFNEDARVARTTLLRMGPRGAVDTLRQPEREIAYLRHSPDGRTLAIGAGVGRESSRHVGLYDFDTGSYTQWTFEGGAHAPVWSPDGGWIAYSAELPGSVAEDLYIAPLDGSAPPRRITSLPGDQHATSWPTPNLLVFGVAGDAVFTVDPLAAEPAPTEYLPARAEAGQVEVSSDGRFAAHVAAVAGDPQIFVRRFPETGGQTRITREGGLAPRWSADGRSVLYTSPDRRTILAARLQLEPRVTVLRIDTIARLSQPTRTWDLDPGSGRFVVMQTDMNRDRLIVISNWLDGLRQMGR